MNIKYCTLSGILLFMGSVVCKAQTSQNPFLIDYKLKTATTPAYKEMAKPQSSTTAMVSIDAGGTSKKISNDIYGINSNPYSGNIDQNSLLIGYLNKLSPNIIRLPGGSLSDVFFWDASPGNLPSGVPDSVWDGGTTKWVKNYEWYGRNSWSFQIDGYYNMLKETSSTGIITVNFGYARYGKSDHPVQQAAHYAADWVRYDNGRTKFWEIGNENYGSWESGYKIDTKTNKDGQPEYMSGAEYAKIAKVYIDSMRAAASEIGSTIYIGTQVMVQPQPGYDTLSVNWNSEYFANAGNIGDFFIHHNYFTVYNQNSTPSQVLNSVNDQFSNIDSFYHQLLNTIGLVSKPIAMTEWNIFSVGSKQMCSYVNGMHAAMVLGELSKHPYYGEASIWDVANGYDDGNDMGMFKIEAQSSPPVGVPQWNPRPVFFYMYYFQKFFGDHSLPVTVSGNSNVLAYGSSFNSGQLGVVVVNRGTSDQKIQIQPQNFTTGSRYYLYSLTGGTDNPPFSQVVNVNGVGPDYATGGPINELDTLKAWSASIKGGITFDSPAMSVQYVLIESSKQNTAISDNPVTKPASVTLEQNYPNPFNPTTEIKYELNKPVHVTIKIFNILGQQIATLIDDKQPAGVHLVQWNGHNSQGMRVSSGVYIYQLVAGNVVKTKKMLLLK